MSVLRTNGPLVYLFIYLFIYLSLYAICLNIDIHDKTVIGYFQVYALSISQIVYVINGKNKKAIVNVVIYWLLCFEQVYNKRIDLLNKGSLGGRLIIFALFIINRLIISGGKLINLP